jgi:hypothetical protein
VFTQTTAPVERGFVASLARPGGNLTGINFLSQEVTAKRLERKAKQELPSPSSRLVRPNQPCKIALTLSAERPACYASTLI